MPVWVLVLLGFGGLFSLPSTCEALSQEYATAAKAQYLWMIDKRPIYRMDSRIAPLAPIDEGVDCSRYKFLVYRRAHIPGVQRVTAEAMSHGKGGWAGKDISLDQAEELDMIWWTWKKKPQRIRGHVGTFIIGGSGLLEVTHASQSRGHIVVEPLRGVLLEDIAVIRRITIGEP